MMTRKDFAAFAETFRFELQNFSPDYDYPLQRGMIAFLARRIAQDCKRSNPSFRYDKFYEACGLTSWGALPEEEEGS